jgi:multiple sugar transport system permease protein
LSGLGETGTPILANDEMTSHSAPISRETTRFAWILVAPVVVLVLAVAIYPISYAIQFSLSESVVFMRTGYAGLAHYSKLLNWSVGRNLLASLIFVLASTAFAVVAGLGLALALNGKIALRTTVRTIIFIPWVVSEIAVALIWRWLANPDYGPAVHLLKTLGLPQLDFLGDARLAMAFLVLANVWRSVAFTMIVLLAALQGVPENVLRAARVDGAGAWRTFWSVTLPLLMPSIVVCIMLSSFSYFNVVTLPLVLTGGGPMDSTEVLTLRMYREGFDFFDVGFASALTMLILAVNVILTIAYLKVPHERI